jgi:hypothetical protein
MNENEKSKNHAAMVHIFRGGVGVRTKNRQAREK